MKTTIPSPERLTYRVSELVELLGVSKSTIHRAIEKGQIKAVKLAEKTYLIPAAAVEALLSVN